MTPEEYRAMLSQLTEIVHRQRTSIARLEQQRRRMDVSLYDTDFYAWTQQQAEALAQGDVASLDFAHLAEEIESLGTSERRVLRSAIQNIMLHLLKTTFSQGSLEPMRGWRISARNGRRMASREITEQPSLARELEQVMARAYRYAKQDAHDQLADHGETHAPFPEACPWTLDQLLDEDFWPER